MAKTSYLYYAESISYKDGRIKTKLNEIVCWLGDETMVTCRVIVRRTTTIPSLTATWLPVDIPGSDNLTKYGYIEATINPETNLAIISGIMDMEKAEKCIRIINPSEKPVILCAKQSVGTCEPYEDKHSDVDTCSSANIQPS